MPETKQSPAARLSSPAIVWAIGPAFLVLAAVFLMLPKGSGIPTSPPEQIDPASLSTQPRFEVLGDPPRLLSSSYELTCMECHQLFPSNPDRSHQLLQHADIEFEHGMNNRCLNCHHDTDRDKLTLLGGEAVGYSQAHLVCGQCHGTTMRQWERGVHGKTMGYWDETLGPQEHLTCIQCHDPHSPGYESVAPLPGPNTLRMHGTSSGRPVPEHHALPHNPLRPDYSAPAQGDHGSAPSHDSQTPVEEHEE